MTYNGQALQAVALCSQKNYMSLYLMNVYGDKDTPGVVRGGVPGQRQKAEHG